MKTKFQATFSLDKETQERLAEYAKTQRMSKSQALTQLIWKTKVEVKTDEADNRRTD